MVSTDLLVRPADETDAPAAAAVQLAARAAAPMPPGVHPAGEVEDRLRRRLAADDAWVAEDDGRVVGYARVRGDWLDDLYVAPAAAGAGVGSTLLDLVKHHRPAGFCLWVFESNLPARRFYAARGLVELEHTDGRANEERAPDVRMAWPGADPLRFLRRLIDEVDADLGEVLARRAALTAAVQRHKPGRRRDPVRERAVAEALAARAPALGVERVARIVDAIITESLDAAATPSPDPPPRDPA